ncbi:hypothetical protein Tco_0873849 [Tanacetum coccineum]|uniref:Xylulose kinase-1 n=1 Tax=Tanacetum coccineum TaxID=301880 RepID=A0ABQ5BKS3_9ASTR
MTTLQYELIYTISVAFLAKPAESEGFEQIVDFLNAHTIKYALTVNLTIYTSCIKQFWATIKVKIVNKEVQLQALVDGKKIIVTDASVRRDLQLNDEEDNIANKAVNKEMDDSLVRATTTATGLDAEQDNGNIDKTQSKATPDEPSSLGTSSGGGLNHQETMGDTIAQTGFENVSKTSNDSLLAEVNIPRSDEDILKLNELMEFCSKLQQRVLDLENTKTTQAQEITSLKLGVKKLEKKGGSRTHKLKRLYKVGKSAKVISSDEGRYGDEEMFDTCVLDGDEVLAEPEVNLSVDEVTLAQALAALKSAKVQEKSNVEEEPSKSITTTHTLTTTAATTIIAISTRSKSKGLVIHKEEQATTPTVSSQQPSQVKAHDKGKGIMVEEPVKMKKKDQISLDEELAFKLQAKKEEEESLAREKAQREEEEANIVSWDNVQAMIDADY